MKYIELFAGCGGLSLGLESAGFDLLFANELSPMASETFAYNLLDVDFDNETNIEKVLWISSTYERSKLSARLRENPQLATGLNAHHFSDVRNNELTQAKLEQSLLVGSITDINSILSDSNSDLARILTQELDEEVDLVSGGPPCQSFSLAGLREHSNKRNSLPWEFAKFVDHVRPKIALLENVSGILRAFKIDGRPYYAWFEVAKAFAKVGYIPICLHLNAKYVGAAQNRPRFVLIGIRQDVFKKIEENIDDEELKATFVPINVFCESISNGEDPAFGSLPYFDLEKDHPLFESSLFSSLRTHKNKSFVTVKDAIDDLRGPSISVSSYVEELNEVLANPNGHALNKNNNHDQRTNNVRVRARFRLYQIISKLDKRTGREIRHYLSSEGSSGIASSTVRLIQAFWILDLNGRIISSPSDSDILDLLSSIFTKKQTQRALKADSPAPAALSIPDDACHYHESAEMLRTLTVREMARIQSFPDWYTIKSKVTTGGQMRKFEVPQYTQIGNAVPPLLGVALGKVCKKLIKVSVKL
jgi:DNA (cytosine-5)-methyltransferase 1